MTEIELSRRLRHRKLARQLRSSLADEAYQRSRTDELRAARERFERGVELS